MLPFCSHIELMLNGPHWLDQDISQQLVVKLRKMGCQYSVHPPAGNHMNLTSASRETRQFTFVQTVCSIQIAHQLQASAVVVHPGQLDPAAPFSRETAQEMVLEAIDKLNQAARPLGVTLLIENTGRVFEMEEFCHIADGFDGNVGYLIDTGHAHLDNWDMVTLMNRLGHRLQAFHLHDNDGSADQHAPIGDGAIQWDAIFRQPAIKNLNLILEYRPGTPLERARADLERLRQWL